MFLEYSVWKFNIKMYSKTSESYLLKRFLDELHNMEHWQEFTKYSLKFEASNLGNIRWFESKLLLRTHCTNDKYVIILGFRHRVLVPQFLVLRCEN